MVSMAFNGRTAKRTGGDCVVCGKALPIDKYVYRIEKCKVNKVHEPYDLKGAYGHAHMQCLLNQIGSPTTLLEVLRLANEGDSNHS